MASLGAMAHSLFTRKPLELLLAEAEGEHRLRRVLGPVQLTSLGIGAVIGAGIFVSTGAVAKNVTGPALMLSYAVAGLVCILAALCYAELASMVPVAGSAYTFAFATLGELLAWIIGWDLVLEYAVRLRHRRHRLVRLLPERGRGAGVRLAARMGRAGGDLRPGARPRGGDRRLSEPARGAGRGPGHRRPGGRHPRERAAQHAAGRRQGGGRAVRDRGRRGVRRPRQLAAVRAARLRRPVVLRHHGARH